jgi:beta-N-acetylhexosaminidase
LALAAGSDLLLFANQQVYEPDVLASTLDTIEELVANGKISEEQIDASVARLEQLSRRAP